jgi:hypothetical protein
VTALRAATRWDRLLRGAPLVLLGSTLALAHVARATLGPLDPLLARLPVLCPLRAIAGIACPTCGLGRALVDAWAGDFRLAWGHHPLGPLLLCGALGAACLCAVRPQALSAALAHIATQSRRHPRLLSVALLTYVAWGFARLSAGTLAH